MLRWPYSLLAQPPYLALTIFCQHSPVVLRLPGMVSSISKLRTVVSVRLLTCYSTLQASSNLSSLNSLHFSYLPLIAFIYIGAWMPFHLFTSAALTLSVWRLIVLAILVFMLRRLPIMLALYRWIPDVKTFREAFFSGLIPIILFSFTLAH